MPRAFFRLLRKVRLVRLVRIVRIVRMATSLACRAPGKPRADPSALPGPSSQTPTLPVPHVVPLGCGPVPARAGGNPRADPRPRRVQEPSRPIRVAAGSGACRERQRQFPNGHHEATRRSPWPQPAAAQSGRTRRQATAPGRQDTHAARVMRPAKPAAPASVNPCRSRALRYGGVEASGRQAPDVRRGLGRAAAQARSPTAAKRRLENGGP